MAITGKAAEDILERIFQPTTKPSARDQAEETLRHPKRLVYVAMSNRSFYWRAHIQKFVLDSGPSQTRFNNARPCLPYTAWQNASPRRYCCSFRSRPVSFQIRTSSADLPELRSRYAFSRRSNPGSSLTPRLFISRLL